MQFNHPDLPDIVLNVHYDVDSKQLTLSGVELDTSELRFTASVFAGALDPVPDYPIIELEEATEPIYAEAEAAAAALVAAENDTPETPEDTPQNTA
jgi:hypothetical protein